MTTTFETSLQQSDTPDEIQHQEFLPEQPLDEQERALFYQAKLLMFQDGIRTGEYKRTQEEADGYKDAVLKQLHEQPDLAREYIEEYKEQMNEKARAAAQATETVSEPVLTTDQEQLRQAGERARQPGRRSHEKPRISARPRFLAEPGTEQVSDDDVQPSAELELAATNGNPYYGNSNRGTRVGEKVNGQNDGTASGQGRFVVAGDGEIGFVKRPAANENDDSTDTKYVPPKYVDGGVVEPPSTGGEQQNGRRQRKRRNPRTDDSTAAGAASTNGSQGEQPTETIVIDGTELFTHGPSAENTRKPKLMQRIKDKLRELNQDAVEEENFQLDQKAIYFATRGLKRLREEYNKAGEEDKKLRKIAMVGAGVLAVAGAGLLTYSLLKSGNQDVAVDTLGNANPQPGAENLSEVPVPRTSGAESGAVDGMQEVTLEAPADGRHDTVWDTIQDTYGTNNAETADILAEAREAKQNAGIDLDNVDVGDKVYIPEYNPEDDAIAHHIIESDEAKKAADLADD